jgi:arsenite methyltransferase
MNYMRSLMHGHSHKADYSAKDEPPILNTLAVGGIMGIGLAALLASSLPQEQKLWAYLALAVGLVLIAPKALIQAVIWRYGRRRFAVRDAIETGVPWRGDEQALDVGTGNGILLIGAARHLTTGKATGIDIWQPHSGGGTAANFWNNVRAEGVTGRVDLQNMDARQMTFSDESFDVITSSLALHHIGENRAERDRAVREMWRVLKPGGTIALYDIGAIVNPALERLRQLGITDVHEEGKFFKFIMGRKPARNANR